MVAVMVSVSKSLDDVPFIEVNCTTNYVSDIKMIIDLGNNNFVRLATCNSKNSTDVILLDCGEAYNITVYWLSFNDTSGPKCLILPVSTSFVTPPCEDRSLVVTVIGEIKFIIVINFVQLGTFFAGTVITTLTMFASCVIILCLIIGCICRTRWVNNIMTLCDKNYYYTIIVTKRQRSMVMFNIT